MEAARHAAPLRIVSAPTAMPRIRAYHASAETVAVALRGISERALETALARAEEVAPGLPAATALLSGPPALAVVASGTDAAMLVVGARGAGGFTAMVLGSVSRYAATRAACPVVVVRHEAMAVHGEIAVGIRDPQRHRRHARLRLRGSGQARREPGRGARLVLDSRRAAEGLDRPGRHRCAGPTRSRSRTEAARTMTMALDQWRDKYPGVRARPDVIRGHPGRVLASYSARADLVVLGGTAVRAERRLDPVRGPRPRPRTGRHRARVGAAKKGRAI